MVVLTSDHYLTLQTDCCYSPNCLPKWPKPSSEHQNNANNQEGWKNVGYSSKIALRKRNLSVINLYSFVSSNLFQMPALFQCYGQCAGVHFKNHAMTAVFSHQPPTPEAQVQSQASPCGMWGAQSGSRKGFSLTTLVLPCQCHSISAPNSFTHFSLTLHNLISLTIKYSAMLKCKTEINNVSKNLQLEWSGRIWHPTVMLLTN